MRKTIADGGQRSVSNNGSLLPHCKHCRRKVVAKDRCSITEYPLLLELLRFMRSYSGRTPMGHSEPARSHLTMACKRIDTMDIGKGVGSNRRTECRDCRAERLHVRGHVWDWPKSRWSKRERSQSSPSVSGTCVDALDTCLIVSHIRVPPHWQCLSPSPLIPPESPNRMRSCRQKSVDSG